MLLGRAPWVGHRATSRPRPGGRVAASGLAVRAELLRPARLTSGSSEHLRSGARAARYPDQGDAPGDENGGRDQALTEPFALAKNGQGEDERPERCRADQRRDDCHATAFERLEDEEGWSRR